MLIQSSIFLPAAAVAAAPYIRFVSKAKARLRGLRMKVKEEKEKDENERAG